MVRRTMRLSALAIASLITALSADLSSVQAQTPYCEGYRAELAALDRNANSGAAQHYRGLAARQQAELGRLSAQYRSLGCDRGGFLIFGNPTPPQCGAIGAQMRQLQSSIAGANAAAEQSGGDGRRQRLAALVQQHCRPGAQVAGPQPQRPRNLFEALFGRSNRFDPDELDIDPRDRPGAEVVETPREDGKRYGGSKLVCVKTCDGSFFPLSNSPGGRAGADEMCQSLCPGTETHAYGMQPGGDIDRAGSVTNGEPYSSLPNAGRFKTSFDSSCSCRQPGQSWANALQEAEEKLGTQRSDIIVTTERSEELSRILPELEKNRDKSRGRGKQKPGEQASSPVATAPQPDPLTAPIDPEPPAQTNTIPATNENASGIPADMPDRPMLGQNEGNKQQMVGTDGTKKTIRVIETPRPPAGSEAKAPQAPGRPLAQ